MFRLCQWYVLPSIQWLRLHRPPELRSICTYASCRLVFILPLNRHPRSLRESSRLHHSMATILWTDGCQCTHAVHERSVLNRITHFIFYADSPRCLFVERDCNELCTSVKCWRCLRRAVSEALLATITSCCTTAAHPAGRTSLEFSESEGSDTIVSLPFLRILVTSSRLPRVLLPPQELHRTDGSAMLC